MPVIVKLPHQGMLSGIRMISRITDFRICKEDTQVFHREIPNQFHLREISMQDYKSMCETIQRIHRVLFVISEFLYRVLYS